MWRFRRIDHVYVNILDASAAEIEKDIEQKKIILDRKVSQSSIPDFRI